MIFVVVICYGFLSCVCLLLHSFVMMLAEIVCASMAVDGLPRLANPSATFASDKTKIFAEAIARLRVKWPALVPLIEKCSAAEPRDRYTSRQALAALVGCHPCRIPVSQVLTVNPAARVIQSPHRLVASATLMGSPVTAMVLYVCAQRVGSTDMLSWILYGVIPPRLIADDPIVAQPCCCWHRCW